ncbi:MAG: hypothetical protein ACKN9U_16760, partial [Pirellulaceae bacterium]
LLATVALANPEDAKANRAWLSTVDQIRKLSGQFGLSPLDRSRLKIEKKSDEPDAFMLWLQRSEERREPMA